ncbi:MAG: hypothetical protein HYV26_04430 [Candidatus Hydrogenedentes bacterium]|nr:hypothetical protein [Candidatus Hydrogenedentota bacterium]
MGIAIFLTIMTGVAALFASSVDAMRTGYRSMEAFEVGRSTLGILEQDLKNAFTARELGQYYQFYGTPFGFMFVGSNENGQLTRITYAVHSAAGGQQFNTTFAEVRGTLRDRLIKQGMDLGFDAATANAIVLSWFPGDGTEVQEAPALVTTGGLVRFAQTGMSDLEVLQLPDGVSWPGIDLLNPVNDRWDNTEGRNRNLYIQVLSALNPDAANLNDGRDIRVLMDNIIGSGDPLTALGPETIGTLVEARIRELWLRMVAGQQDLPDLWTGMGRDPRDYVVADSIVTSAQPKDPVTGALLTWPDADGTPANALYASGYFYYSNSVQEYSTYFNALQNIEPPRSLQAINNAQGLGMIGYKEYMQAVAVASNPENVLQAFDRTLTESVGGTRLASDTLGSPLLPQLPNIVRPGFWIMKPATRPGGADFRRWFGQGIDVPSALNRSIEASLIANPSQV